MTSLYDIIKSLQTTQGTIAKQAILDANKDNELLKAYMKAVLDPAINYYQTKLPAKLNSGGPPLLFLTSELIAGVVDSLAGRKVTGFKAKQFLHDLLCDLEQGERELVGYIIKRKIDKSNVGETMVLKTWPGLFFTVPYMRCASMSAKIVEYYRGKRRFYVQPKRDGSFAYLSTGFAKDAHKAITRAGNVYPAWFSEQLSCGLCVGIVLVGELEVYLEGILLDRKTGNGILNSIMQGEEPSAVSQYDFKYVAWDVLYDDEFESGKSDRHYLERLLQLGEVLADISTASIEQIETHEVESVEEAFAINTTLTTAGKEGTVWKDMGGIWRDTSSGTKDCVKLKVKFQADYKVTGFYGGEGKAAGMLGGITIATSDDLLACNCGSGFSDTARKELWAMFNEHGVDGLIAEIEANDVITNKDRPGVMALSLGIFIELRPDKTVADSLQRVIEQRDAARMGL